MYGTRYTKYTQDINKYLQIPDGVLVNNQLEMGTQDETRPVPKIVLRFASILCLHKYAQSSNIANK